MFRRISRVTAWLLLFLIAVFSVISPYNRVVTIVPHTVEHLASFLFVGAWQLGSATPLGTGHRVFFYCARPLLSLRNFGLRGRHARIGDFLVYLLVAHTGKRQLPPFDDAAVDKIIVVCKRAFLA